MATTEQILKAYAKKTLIESRPNVLIVVDKKQIEKYFKFLLSLHDLGQFELPTEESVSAFIEE